MPKIIENVKETILQNAKKVLLTDGYDSLSLRGIATHCNIAVGTIYNYFPSKLALITAIMLEDWAKHTEKRSRICAEAESAEAGLQSLFFNLREFALLYQAIWNMALHSAGQEFKDEMVKGRSRRQLVVEQLAGEIHTLLKRFGLSQDPFLPRFIANTLLTYALEPNFDYNQLDRIFKSILNGIPKPRG